MIYFQEEGDFAQGALIVVDKPLEWTSFDVVNKIRSTLRKKHGKMKVGHAGTLDPLATGIVMVCTGKWTKRIEELMAGEKEYVATVEFGATTPSCDLESEIDERFPFEHITRELLEEKIKDFVGVIQQAPPIFSAVRIDGVRAYEKARKGHDVEMPTRPVEIKEIEIMEFNPPIAKLRIVCGKGTYIRSIARDLGEACNSGAHLTGLVRTRVDKYMLIDANNMQELVVHLQNMD
ncbi:MAG: tRNA pseudouridine(55) synthase TruB [Marinifilaceae bacterium]